MRQQTTIDAERAARTPVNPAKDARVNLVDLRVGNKPETFAGEEWKSWSFKMRHYIAAVDEEFYLELVNVEANPLREMPLARMNEPQKRSDPANGFEISKQQHWHTPHKIQNSGDTLVSTRRSCKCTMLLKVSGKRCIKRTDNGA